MRQLSDGQARRRADFDGSGPTSRATMIRDLNALVARELIRTFGTGRGTIYQITDLGRQAVVYDADAYFRQPPGSRTRLTHFEPALLRIFDGALSAELRQRVERARLAYLSQRPAQLPVSAARRELEHFTIELSWISSKYEGNTYSVFDTERLIKDGVEAPGHTQFEARMILNHKRALDYIYQHRAEYVRLSKVQVLEVHQLLSADLDILQGLRDIPVRITGTAYVPPTGRAELNAYLNDSLRAINQLGHPAEKALATLSLLAYLQPFADGNKRTSRLMANAVLLAHDYPPLSFFTATEEQYKQAMLLLYEQGAIGNLAALMTEQLEYAGQHYYLEAPIRERQRHQPEERDRRSRDEEWGLER